MRNEWLREFWRYRELFYLLAWRDVKVRYKQTLLGASWAIIQPLFTMVVFTLLFGNLAHMPNDGIPYPVFYFCALLPWLYFSGALANSGNSLVLNANLITKVYFPRVILPTSAAIGGLVDFCIGSILLLGIMVYYGIHPGWKLLFWPFLIVPLVVFSLGVGMILAALNVKYRDIKHIIPFLIQLWLFVTPVIYPTSLIPERYRLLALLNPMTGIIEAFRSSVEPNKQMEWQWLAISFLTSIIIFVVGALYFRQTERTFADNV